MRLGSDCRVIVAPQTLDCMKQSALTKKSVVHLVEGFNRIGGPPRLVRLLISSELNQEFEFHVVTYSAKWWEICAWSKVYFALLRLKATIVHVHGLKADGFFATFLCRLAFVPNILLTVHGSVADAINQYTTNTAKLSQLIVAKLLEPMTLLMADAVYCVCDAMHNQKRIQRYARKRLFPTIHNGVEHKSPVASVCVTRSSLGFTKLDVIVVYTGRVTRDKGIFDLIEAFCRLHEAEVRQNSRLTKLIIVGDGENLQEARDLLKVHISRRVVVLTGCRTDAEQITQCSDIFLLPSLHENASFSLLEAMSAGCAVIASAVGGNVELIEDGKSGVLVPPSNPTALMNAMWRLVQNPDHRKVLGYNAQQRALTQFTAKLVIRRTRCMYKAIVNAG